VITYWCISAVGTVFSGAFAAMPTGPTLGLNAKAVSLVGTGIFGGAGWVNAYLPVDAVMEGVGVLVTLFLVMWAIRLVLWFLTKLHVLGGSGDD
jgi:hypothetical protein